MGNIRTRVCCSQYSIILKYTYVCVCVCLFALCIEQWAQSDGGEK